MQGFTYPPGSKSHEYQSWEFSGEIIVQQKNSGTGYQLSNRIVQIAVTGKDKHIYLLEEFKFTAGHIEASIEWNQFENIRIILFEIGMDHVMADEYSRQLAKEPGRKKQLVELQYIFSPDEKKFKRKK